jgi:hypothetical protein
MSILYIEHYQKAWDTMTDPKFLEQELLLAWYDDVVYRTKPGYSVNGLH